MLWKRVTAESLWASQLTPILGGWVLIFLRSSVGVGTVPGPVPLAGRVVGVDRAVVRLSTAGSEFIVPLAEILYILKPGPAQQDDLTLTAMTQAATRKEL